jgi:2-Cys peroxiredoxin 5
MSHCKKSFIVFTSVHKPMMLRTSIFLFVIVAVATAFSPLNQASARSSTALNMAVEEVKVGDKIPSVNMAEGKPDYGRPETVNIAELCAGKKVAIFAVPGAFTPGCSKSHLPSFISAQDELKAKGVELTICIATNDAFVMEVS